jgi:hypothetical protein
MGLHVQDAELASLYHAPPNLRHTANRHYFACSKEVFDAPDAQSWAKAMRAHPPLPFSVRQYFQDRRKDFSSPDLIAQDIPDPEDDFTLYIILVGIQAQVCEAREVETLFTPETQREISSLLLCWYQSYVHYRNAHPQYPGGTPFCLMILWHSIWVSLFSNIQVLETAFGSRGTAAAAEQVEVVSSWASSPTAKRAALHVMRIRALLSQLSISLVPSVHLPRVAFQSAIVCWCYIRFKEPSPTPRPVDTELEGWTEFAAAGVNVRSLEMELSRIRGGWGSDQPLGPFSEILHRLGQWGLAKKLGGILNVAIHEETNFT